MQDDDGEGPLAPRLQAVALEEERGRGRFRCGTCGAQWTSNRACRGLGQLCQAEGCDAAERKELTFPHEIRQPKPLPNGGTYLQYMVELVPCPIFPLPLVETKIRKEVPRMLQAVRQVANSRTRP